MILALALAALAPSAHSPHDTISHVAVSPTFDRDATLLAVGQLSEVSVVLRSRDGGRSFEAFGAEPTLERVNAIRMSPAFADDGVAFLATQLGGVFATADGGDTWTRTNTGLGDLRVRDLSVSPGFALDGTLLAATPSGVYRSTDAGASWSLSWSGASDSGAEAVAFAPSSPLTALAGTRRLQRSDDGGATWTPLATIARPLVDIEPSDGFVSDGVVVACFGSSGGFVETSFDGGATFATTALGLTDPVVHDVTVTDTGAVFAVTRLAGVFRSPLPGGPFQKVSQGFEAPAPQTSDHYLDVDAAPSFGASGVVAVASFEGLYLSDDGGFSWRQGDVYPVRVLRNLRFSPAYATSGELYAGSYGGGVGRYSRDDAWPGSTATSLAPVEAGAWLSRATGLASLHSAVLELSPSYASDRTMYYAHTSFERTLDGGDSWSSAARPAGVTFVRSLALSPAYASDRTLALSGETGQGLWLSTDASASWTQLTAGLPTSRFAGRHLAFSPAFASDRTLVVAVHEEGVVGLPDQDAVYVSSDAGASFTSGVAGLPTFRRIRALLLSPEFALDRTLWIGTERDGVFRSIDGGASWTAAGPPAPAGAIVDVRALAVSPAYASDRTLFAATMAHGLWRSQDRGTTWTRRDAGLPLAAPWRLALSPSFDTDGTALLATFAGPWVTVDAGASWAPLPGYDRVDDADQVVRTTGAWVARSLAGSLGGQHLASFTTGDAVELDFVGDSIAWVGVRDQASGIAEVLVDGVSAGDVDLYAPGNGAAARVFRRFFDTVGAHSIRIESTGRKSAPSLSIQVQTDGFEIGFGGAASYRPYGEAHAGSEGREPALTGAGSPAPGGSIVLAVSRGLGGALGALALATTPTSSPYFGGTLLVTPPWALWPHTLAGAAGAAGMGTLALPALVPNDPTLSGASLWLQGGWIDGGAAGGVSFSRGLQVRIP